MTKTLDLFGLTDDETQTFLEIVRGGYPCQACKKEAACLFSDWQTCELVRRFEEAELEVFRRRAFCVTCSDRDARTCKFQKKEFDCLAYERKSR